MSTNFEGEAQLPEPLSVIVPVDEPRLAKPYKYTLVFIVGFSVA